MLRDNRTLEQFEGSSRRIRLYEDMETFKIDTSNISSEETIKRIIQEL